MLRKHPSIHIFAGGYMYMKSASGPTSAPVIGAGSAILTIVIEFQHLSRRLQRFVKSLKHAPTELEMLISETEVFWQLLEVFHELVEEDDNSPKDGFSGKIRSIKISEHILGNNAVPEKIESLMRQLDRRKERIRSLQASVKELQKQCETQELSNKERQAFEINVVLAQETGKTVRAYIKQHRDIKIILNSGAPVSTLLVGSGISSQSSSASVGGGSQPSSGTSNVLTPDTSLVAESSSSPGRSEVSEDTTGSHSQHSLGIRSDTTHSEGELRTPTTPPTAWVPTALWGPPIPNARPSRPRPPTPRPDDGNNDEVVERDDTPVIRRHPHELLPPIRPSGQARRPSLPEDRPPAPRPQSPDGHAQDIVVDRNDGLGPRHEYRPPRKPQRPPKSQA